MENFYHFLTFFEINRDWHGVSIFSIKLKLEGNMLKCRNLDSMKDASLTEKLLSVVLGIMISLLTIVVLGIVGL